MKTAKEQFFMQELESILRLVIDYSIENPKPTDKQKELLKKLYRQVNEFAEKMDDLFKQGYVL